MLLLVSFVSTVATSYISDYWANYFANLAANYKLQFINDTQQQETQKPDTLCSMRVEEGPNGTKNVFIQAEVTLNLEARASGSVFDASTYMRYILMWESIENTCEFLRNVSRMFAESIFCVFCFLVLLQSKIFKYQKFRCSRRNVGHTPQLVTSLKFELKVGQRPLNPLISSTFRYG